MREWIPVPGSVKARLVEAGLEHFEALGYEQASVVEIAHEAGATTGALYHHFGSKLGLFRFVREEMLRRVQDRMEGAHAAVGGGWPGVVSGLLVSFDAAVHFKAARILSEPDPGDAEEHIVQILESLVAPAPATTATILLGAWRAALALTASGTPPDQARRGLAWVLGNERHGPSGPPRETT